MEFVRRIAYLDVQRHVHGLDDFRQKYAFFQFLVFFLQTHYLQESVIILILKIVTQRSLHSRIGASIRSISSAARSPSPSVSFSSVDQIFPEILLLVQCHHFPPQLVIFTHSTSRGHRDSAF